jgi:hypothetical protein
VCVDAALYASQITVNLLKDINVTYGKDRGDNLYLYVDKPSNKYRTFLVLFIRHVENAAYNYGSG